MTAPAEVRYARSSGDLDIAYTVFGDGPFDLVVVMGFVTHLDLQWQLPWYEAMRAMGGACRVLVFDKRGTGLSDRSLGYGSLEERSDDIRAVMDAAGSQRAVIYGISESGPMALLFAATYPDRVQALVLYGTWARAAHAPDYPIGFRQERLDAFTDLLVREWGTGRAFGGIHVQHVPDTAEAGRFLAQFERNACTPQMVAEIERRNFEMDVRSILPTISAPTLVMHCAGDPLVPVEGGRYLGEHIADARYVEIDGDFHGSWRTEDTAKLIPPFLEFLGSIGFEEPPPPATRALATILFTDIVGSTERAAEVGDRAWRELLDKHDATAAARVAEFGGHLVKTTGDGLLATFDGPTAGMGAARAIRESVAAFDVEIRAGVHTGEVELRGGDVGGIGVHIGARIAALARPGEILVSRTVKDLVTGSGIMLEDRGSHTLKGVPDEWQVYAVEN
ncbi:MAG TPA: adenylate/guanylate cyclase domain-containing protein [Acidimicrobiales bacterium]|nr:adenylate/guanylate cyclase domain-containing protein [Acidimicrobiales bacterium]